MKALTEAAAYWSTKKCTIMVRGHLKRRLRYLVKEPRLGIRYRFGFFATHTFTQKLIPDTVS
uniref:Putative ovule protein n=1 Tax=Solanum chacoense TaxID=4108 RepID=A0A0V0I503_SOLCH